MSHRSVLAIVLAAAAVVATPVLAQRGPHGRQAGPGGPEHMALGPVVQILHDLDLDDTQRSQIHEIVQRYRDLELAARAKDLMQARHAHQLNIWDPSATAADLDASRAAVAERQRDLDDVVHRMAGEVLGVLTEDQRAEFRTRLTEMPVDQPPMQPRMRGPMQGAPTER